jgi:hypothetical protein
LPVQCAGCGAFSQTSDATEPGFYTLTRRSVETYIQGGPRRHVEERSIDGQALVAAVGKVDSTILESLQSETDQQLLSSQTLVPPVCDRCHKLRHHHAGISIQHPSIQSIQETILESPHKYNHIYHVIDAADFPMSLIPGLHRLLHLTPQRSLNRRAKTGKFYHGKKTEISFIITRSDLLAPVKAQVDSMMPYLVEVLRDALGSFGKGVRLGNVRCVSANRDWWTKDLKEDIWKRGGGGWMVGKVNVGKSRLFQSVFPKGRREAVKQDASVSQASVDHYPATIDRDVGPELESLDSLSLLPPARAEVDYPAMPLVHPLPGTTASPIRVPFGGGKGELVDLPGLSRGDLELFVQEQHRLSLVMRSRVVPEQKVIKAGQSLLLGGFIRITPVTPDTIILGYAFTPIVAHLTATEKAIAIQKQEQETGVENISLPGTGEKIASAGRFQLKWDVTKKRSGPITAPAAAGLKVDRLAYRVFSTDILIEGCGWVELVCQVRKKQLDPFDAMNRAGEYNDNHPEPNFMDSQWPEVEVFSPEGKFISSRRPMNAWLLGGPKKDGSRAKGRPRKSMKGAKKMAKASMRATF